MSRLGINTGSNPNDGQGDPLRIAMGKINSNFTEIYNTIGDGNNLISYASTAGISTLARNLTGSPRINVSGILNTGITTTEHLEVRNITSTGVVTATQFVGDGSQLTNVTALVGGLEVLDDNVRKGVARELNFGANIQSTGPDGVGRVTISVASSIAITGIVTNAIYADSSGVAGVATYATIAGVSTYSSVSGVSTYASTAGIATVAQGLTGTPNLNVGIITATDVTFNRIGITTGEINVGYNNSLLINMDGPEGLSTYTFGNGGILSVPGNVEIGGGGGGGYVLFNNNGSKIQSEPTNDFQIHVGGFANKVTGFGTDGSVSVPTNVVSDYYDLRNIGQIGYGGTYLSAFANSRFIIQTNLSGQGEGGPQWTFGTNGSLTFPDSTVQTTSFTGYANTSGIATVAQGLTGTPNITVGQVGITSFLSVTGVTSFYNNVHHEYDQAILIGNNDELQLYHNATNSYIDNSSGNNLIIRTHGGSIQLDKEGPELMGVFNTDGSVELYYNNSKKFETTSIGATVFGTINGSNINISGIVTANSFRPSGGYYQSGNGTNAFYVYDGTGNVAFQGNINVNQINSGSGYKALEFSAETTPVVMITNGLNVTGVTTSTISIPTQLKTKSVAEKTTLVAGNTVGLAFSTGGGNVAICTSPTGDITLNVTDIPTDSSFDNHSISFSVVVNQTGTARTCTAITLNGVSRTIKWAGGSLANAISGVTTSTGFDIFTFTGINTVGSASTTSNYTILGSVNGGFN